MLGVVGFGARRPEILAPDCPFIAAPLRPFSGAPAYEIWTAARPLRRLQLGSIAGTHNDEIAFGAIVIPEHDCSIETATERAYHEIFDFLEHSGKAPIRFWNYLTAITADDNGLERYRHFNIGRHHVFSGRLKQNLPPAASGVGGHEGNSVIYFLAAPEPATPIANPRQVNAYDYPAIYGPRSPAFSRASVYTAQDASCVFISGTASITGHETRHVGDLDGQIAETAENLRAIMQAAATKGEGAWAAKIYLHDAADQARLEPVIDRIFGAGTQRLFLRGEICRAELLLEIEAFQNF